MQRLKELFVISLALVGLLANTWAQSAAPAAAKNIAAATPSQPAVSAADIQALKEGLAAAQQQIQALQEELRHRDQAVQQAQSIAAAAAAKADAAQIQATKQEQTVGEMQSDLADLKSVSFSSSSLKSGNEPVYRNAVLNMQEAVTGHDPETEVYNKQMESPITIRFRGINITPGGYAEGAFLWRSRALSADVSTPFNNLAMPGASQSQISEFYGSGRQSKITTFVDGRMGTVDLSSYVSGDFLSAGVTSTSNSTNSYTLRLRQAWAQAKFTNGVSFLAGQSFTLATENGKGISPDDDMGKTNDARPKTIDAAYNVGFNYARQWGFRITKNVGDKVAVAIAVENPQATVSTHGNVNNFLLGASGDGKSYNSGATYSFNPSPDIIAKIAFDPGFGHYEVLGILDRFADRVFPCVENVSGNPICSTGSSTALGAYNASKEGGGVGASARWLIAHHVVFGLKGFGGNGVGRYSSGGLADASINPDGTLHLLRNVSGLGTIEYKTKKLMLYSYGGVEYAGRTYNFDPIQNKNVGYGAPTFNNSGCRTEVAPGSGGFAAGGTGTCTGDTRALIEGTAGFWYKFYTGPRGTFQYGNQFSYVSRNTWSGNGGLPPGTPGLQPGGLDTMVFSSFRYYLP